MGLTAQLLLTQSEAFQCSAFESRRRLWLAAWTLNVCGLDPDFLLRRSRGKRKKSKSIPKNLISPSMASFLPSLERQRGSVTGEHNGPLGCPLWLGGYQREPRDSRGSSSPDSITLAGERGQTALPQHGVSASYSFQGFEGYAPGLHNSVSPNSLFLAGASAGNKKLVPGVPQHPPS